MRSILCFVLCQGTQTIRLKCKVAKGSTMYYCKRCLNPSTRPGIHFDEEGVCLVCRFGEQRTTTIDWDERRKELQKIAEWGREHSKSSYDCIIPVSGGKDSTRQALYIRDELGLKPLLVSMVYPPEQLNELGAANLANLISLGFDAITFSLDPQVWKKLMLKSFRSHANWARSTELALYSAPVKAAMAYKIPLMFLGENPSYTVGEREDSFTGDATNMRNCNTLSGGDATHYIDEDITLKDIHFYNYPEQKDMENENIRIVYLGYYLQDFNIVTNAKVAIENGLQIRNDPPEDIGDLWGYTSVDEDFRLPNQMIKYIKLGYGYVTDQVCEAMSLGMMNRKTALELVQKYDGTCAPRFIEKFCRYLGITVEDFWETVEKFRNKDIWEKNSDGQWCLKPLEALAREMSKSEEN